jgi:uncharacterized protein (TIGR01777 family)
LTGRGVLITGASGFIGGHVARLLCDRGDTVWAWTRKPARTRARLGTAVRVVGALADIPRHEPIHAVINLAGAPVIGPLWTAARRRLLIDSRVQTTAAVLDWCATRISRPRVMVSASAIGFYGPGGDDWLDESSPAQAVFQSQLCVEREAAANAAQASGIRAVNLRIGLVLGRDGGILPRLALPARCGLAAVIGDGRQWMSWIHIDDLLSIIERTLEDESLAGASNAVAPHPARQREFQRALARVLRRPLWLRVPAVVLRTALGEMAELLVQGQRVTPRRLLEAGFAFRYQVLDAALVQLLTPGHS